MTKIKEKKEELVDFRETSAIRSLMGDVRLGDPGWRERYYKVKFHVDMDNTEFFKR
jgi:5'-3' exonuclease